MDNNMIFFGPSAIHHRFWDLETLKIYLKKIKLMMAGQTQNISLKV